MSAPFREYDPDQTLLFPPSLRDWLPDNHMVYFVLDLVQSLALGAIYAHYDFVEVKDEQGQVIGRRAKTNRGQPAYDPRMMTALLIYAYVTGTPSSRQIEKKCQEDVAFRVLSANQKPDHDTIAEFRRIHLEALSGLFMQVLRLCQKAGLVKLGHVALDGTKVKANASKHKAMSYERMLETEKRLEEEVAKLLAKAQAVDAAEDEQYGKDRRGDELPAELARRESRLAKIREAKAALEREAKERAARDAEAARAKNEERRRKEEETGKKSGGRPSEVPDPEKAVPEPKAQRNFTDPESRIMKDGATKAFEQAYNAQAAVDGEAQVIVAAAVTQQTNDKQQLVPMLKKTEENIGRLPEKASADAGYFSEANVTDPKLQGIDLHVPPDRQKHGLAAEEANEPTSGDVPTIDQMRHKLKTAEGQAVYKTRKQIVEPVFGQIKEARRFRRFSFRGLKKVAAEWNLICLTHNLLKLFRSGWAVPLLS